MLVGAGRHLKPAAMRSGLKPPDSRHRLLQGVHERLDALDQAGMIYWTPNGHPRLKRYLAAIKRPQCLRLRGRHFKSQRLVKEWVDTPTQKPLALLDRIIKASSNVDDMVLDPFCGCSTACVGPLNAWADNGSEIDISEKAAELVRMRGRKETTLLHNFRAIHRTDIPRRTDLEEIPNYRTHKHVLFGRQEGSATDAELSFRFGSLK